MKLIYMIFTKDGVYCGKIYDCIYHIDETLKQRVFSKDRILISILHTDKFEVKPV